MATSKSFPGLLIVAMVVTMQVFLACGQSGPAEPVDTVVPTATSDVPVESEPAPAQTMTPTPGPDLEATVQAMVQAALPTEEPTGTPDLPATIQAGVDATVQAVPPASRPVTSTPAPAASQSAPTTAPLAEAPQTPTPTVIPTPTLAHMVEAIQASLVYIYTSDGGTGTGFVVDGKGLVATNAHVVGDFDTVSVAFEDGRQYEGDVLGIDEIADLAIVELRTTREFDAIELGDSDKVRVGDDVIALGFPLSYDLGSSLTVTRGIISSRRVLKGIEELQTDAAINPGNSGGPLVNRKGEVVGVNYAELALSGGSPVDNVGFSIAINELKDRMPSLIRGESALLPTPTPGQWTRYQNDAFGYAMDIAPGWYLDEETDQGYSALWNEEGIGIMEIFAYYLGDGWTLEEHAESERAYLDETANEDSWDQYELTTFQKRQHGAYEYYVMAYRWRESDEYCESDTLDLIFLSDFYPSKPYGFAVRGTLCESVVDRYGGERDEMLSSFVDQETGTAIVSPTPEPDSLSTYRNSNLGYGIDVMTGWYLDEERENGGVTFWHEDGKAWVDVLVYDLGRGWTLKEHADSERSYLEKLARDNAWEVFEITDFEEGDDEFRAYYVMLYRSQSSAEYCIADNISLIYLSDEYPTKPYGFVVEGGVCEDSFDLYGDSRLDMIVSFLPN